jgi:hypothetical protein
VQPGAGVQQRVLADLHVHVDPGGQRVDDGDAGPLVALDDAVAQQPSGRRQLHPVVDAHRLVRVLGQVRRHGEPSGAVQADDVGEVLLALRVVGRQLLEAVGERGASKAYTLVATSRRARVAASASLCSTTAATEPPSRTTRP